MASRSARRETRRKARSVHDAAADSAARRLSLAAGGVVTSQCSTARSSRGRSHGSSRDAAGTCPRRSTRRRSSCMRGRALDVEDLAAELDRLGFAEDPRLAAPARIASASAAWRFRRAASRSRATSSPRGSSRSRSREAASPRCATRTGGSVAIVRLNPLADRQLVPSARRGPADSRAGGDSAAARSGAPGRRGSPFRAASRHRP